MVIRNSTLVNEIYFITHYKFKNESLLLEVFTPTNIYLKNVTTPYSFERLEFLGDSVLNLVVSIMLFNLYPYEQEGDLTLRKNVLVSGHKLTEMCRVLNLMRLMPECPGRILPRESDTLEALIGAIFIDGGFVKAKLFIIRNWKRHARQLLEAPMDSKSKLYIWAQKRHLPTPVYKMINKNQTDTNYTLTLQLKDTHGFGTVKITTVIKKRGEILAAEAMLQRIENRDKWKDLLKSNCTYITEQDLAMSLEDIKMRLYLWCRAHNKSLPQYKTVEGVTKTNQQQFTTLVSFINKGAYGVSTNKSIAEKKAALKMLLRLCDEEREQKLFSGIFKNCEIDVCIPRNFKSLLDEWVTRNHLGEIIYTAENIESMNLFNVSLTIPKSDLGTVVSQSYRRKLAEHKAAALMIEQIVTKYNIYQSKINDSNYSTDSTNNKIQLHTWTHKKKLPNPIYKVEEVVGLKHSLLFTVSVSVLGQNKTMAKAYNKRSAQQKAAGLMLEQIWSLASS